MRKGVREGDMATADIRHRIQRNVQTLEKGIIVNTCPGDLTEAPHP